MSGSNSVVESQLPKLLVGGSIPLSRSILMLTWLVARILMFLRRCILDLSGRRHTKSLVYNCRFRGVIGQGGEFFVSRSRERAYNFEAPFMASLVGAKSLTLRSFSEY